MDNKKRTFEKKDYIGGVLACIAFIAIIAEIIIGGFSPEAIAGGVKDLTGQLINVMILITVLLSLPKKNNDFDFEKQLDSDIESWLNEHKNMISVKEDKRDLYMKTDIANFFEGGQSKAVGRFVKIETGSKIKLTFSLNKSLFVGHGEDKEVSRLIIEKDGEMMCRYANSLFSEIAEISYDKSGANIIFALKNVPQSEDETRKIIEIIDTMYQSFLVCASVKK